MPELFYSRVGQGEPLLILHGLFGSSRNWQSLARRYAEHYEVFSVDLRNHGQSFHTEEMSYPLMAEDVSRLVDQLGLGDIRVIGHSMGGKVAMQLAIEHGNLLNRIVVADIAPVSYQHDHNDTVGALMAVDIERINSRADADAQLQPLIGEAPLRAFLLQNLGSQVGQWQWRFNLASIDAHMDNLTCFDISDEQRINLPALFIYGTRSDYVTEAEQAVIRQHFERANLQAVENAGHWLHAERPEHFVDLTLSYLRD